MRFIPTPLEGAYIVELEKREDLRGFFARTFCANEFAAMGLKTSFPQTNMSFTKNQNTIRGMHFQTDGAEEVKLIRCTQGKILDVIIDLRKDAPTYGKHFMVELSQENYKMLYVPEKFAHGFLTLTPNVEVLYQVSQFYTPGKERGIRWNDPAFAIPWPVVNPILSEKDANHPDFLL